MQEFRPASVIAEDTALAERFHDGDEAALRTLVDRYGAAVVASVTPAVGSDDAEAVARGVFAEAFRRPISPGAELGPWLAGIAAERVGDVDEERWTVAMATGAMPADVRPQLRRHHLEGEALPDEVARHELRLQRRLAHLGNGDEIGRALGRPEAWIDVAPDFADDVLDATGIGRTTGPAAEADVDDVAVAGAGGQPGRPSTTTRLLRPVLLGIGGALAVLVIAVVVLSAASGTPTPPDFTVDLVPTGALVEVDGGEITVTEQDAGLEIELVAPSLPRRAAGAFYEGRLLLVDGSAISVGTFSEGDEVTLWGGTSLADSVAFEIVTRDGGGSRGSGDVVLKVDLPAT